MAKENEGIIYDHSVELANSLDQIAKTVARLSEGIEYVMDKNEEILNYTKKVRDESKQTDDIVQVIKKLLNRQICLA